MILAVACFEVLPKYEIWNKFFIAAFCQHWWFVHATATYMKLSSHSFGLIKVAC